MADPLNPAHFSFRKIDSSKFKAKYQIGDILYIYASKCHFLIEDIEAYIQEPTKNIVVRYAVRHLEENRLEYPYVTYIDLNNVATKVA